MASMMASSFFAKSLSLIFDTWLLVNLRLPVGVGAVEDVQPTDCAADALPRFLPLSAL